YLNTKHEKVVNLDVADGKITALIWSDFTNTALTLSTTDSNTNVVAGELVDENAARKQYSIVIDDLDAVITVGYGNYKYYLTFDENSLDTSGFTTYTEFSYADFDIEDADGILGFESSTSFITDALYKKKADGYYVYLISNDARVLQFADDNGNYSTSYKIETTEDSNGNASTYNVYMLEVSDLSKTINGYFPAGGSAATGAREFTIDLFIANYGTDGALTSLIAGNSYSVSTKSYQITKGENDSISIADVLYTEHHENPITLVANTDGTVTAYIYSDSNNQDLVITNSDDDEAEKISASGERNCYKIDIPDITDTSKYLTINYLNYTYAAYLDLSSLALGERPTYNSDDDDVTANYTHTIEFTTSNSATQLLSPAKLDMTDADNENIIVYITTDIESAGSGSSNPGYSGIRPYTFIDKDGNAVTENVTNDDDSQTYCFTVANLTDPVTARFTAGGSALGYVEFTITFNLSTLTEISGNGDDTTVVPTLTTDTIAYIFGYEDGTVRPEASMSREEAAQLFYNLLTEESLNYFETETNDYSDVESGRWSNTAISTLTAAGIIDGYEDDDFHPEVTITRAELVKIAVGFSNFTEDDFEEATTETSSFIDLASDHWAYSYILAARASGLVSGYEDGSFQADSAITRGEAINVMNSALGRDTDDVSTISDMKTWSDNSDTSIWYYSDIQIATNSY
ncbi:MAG: S-layer homology domain-containing protein, partial [Sporomusa sp.]